MKEVQEGIKNGVKITEICDKLKVSDRSYQRWKKAVDRRNAGGTLGGSE